MPENSSCSSAGSCTKSSCEGCPSHNGGPQSFLVEQNKFSNIKHVIGVVSGKGGVGKSFVTSSLAVNMAKKGYKVGILDADITGPSIPKMFGAHDQILGDENGLMHPYETKEGIKLISVNLLMDNEEDPVIWRGPVIAGVVKQFWNETAWGDIDYLFVDMPPGTGDVPLTVFQSSSVASVNSGTMPLAASSARTSTDFFARRAASSGRNSSAMLLCTTRDSQALHTPIRWVLAFSMMFSAISKSAVSST